MSLKKLLLASVGLGVATFFLWYFFWPGSVELPPNPTGIKTLKELSEIEHQAKAGNESAALEAGLYYLLEGGHEDALKAIQYFKPLAKKGDAQVQYYLGWAYNNFGDLRKATYWYRKAAAQGNKSAKEEILNPNSKEYKQLIQEDEEARLRAIREYEEAQAKKMRSIHSRP